MESRQKTLTERSKKMCMLCKPLKEVFFFIRLSKDIMFSKNRSELEKEK